MRRLNVVLLSVLIAITIFNVIKFSTLQKEEQVIVVEPNISLPSINETQPSYPPTNKIETCSSDLECSWVITNCCSENAGGYWECLNKDSYIDCKSKQTLCIQVISPRPASSCSCVNNLCSG